MYVGIKVSSTKKNLKKATTVELEEINRKYPEFIERINPEKHEATIQYITYAWESEKQHRDLIKKIQSGTGFFFGVLVEKFERTPSHFYVCQNCGSTTIELPEHTCPICIAPASQYKRSAKDLLNPSLMTTFLF